MRGLAISLAMSASVARVYPFFVDFFSVISSSCHASKGKNGQFRPASTEHQPKSLLEAHATKSGEAVSEYAAIQA
jgi:hypothetical protein